MHQVYSHIMQPPQQSTIYANLGKIMLKGGGIRVWLKSHLGVVVEDAK